jgi:hypothetical protein
MKNKFTSILFAFAAVFATADAGANVVISQVYGGGNNSGATYQNDFIELFNNGASAVSINGWSVQYTSASGTSWSSNITDLPNVSLMPGQYFLIQESGGTTNGVALPTPDLPNGAINLSGTNGKVVLVNSTTAATVACPTDTSVVDFVGYGSANCPTPAGVLSNSTAAIRNGGGCANTNNNASDFTVATPTPRNTSSTANVCNSNAPTNPTGVGSATPNQVQAGDPVTLTVVVTPGSNPTSTLLYVEANLTSIGGVDSVELNDDGPNNDGTENFSLQTTVAADEMPGPRSISLTVGDLQERETNPSIALTVIGPPITIMQIQGTKSASDYAGQTVSTQNNIVTALKSNGFFMQDPVGDGLITTSDAVFVFTNSAPAVMVGDSVNVTGIVSEFDGATEIGGSLTNHTLTIGENSQNNALPAPVDLASAAYLPTGNPLSGPCGLQAVPTAVDGYQANNFSCVDGMLVTISNATVTGATFASGADGVTKGTPQGLYAVVTGAPRPFREIGAQYPGLGGSIPVWDGDPEIVEIYYPGLSVFPPTGHGLSEYVYNAGTTFTVTGVIQAFAFSDSVSPFYEIYPTDMSVIDAVTPDELLKPVADAQSNTLTIGTQNFLHFFNNTADGSENHGHYTDNCTGDGKSDSCPSALQYMQRTSKWAQVICDELKSPVVLDLEEVENRSTLADLAAEVTTTCQTVYVPYLIQGNDPSGINNGLLVRSDVNVTSVTQLYLNTQTANCSGPPSNPAPCLLNDRPPVLMRASWNGYQFAVLAIYDRSLSGVGPGDTYVSKKRAEEAAEVAKIVQAWQSGSPLNGAGDARQDPSGDISTGSFDIMGEASVPLIVAGDFNAYQFTDGYVDVTGMIAGTAVQNQNSVWFNGNQYDTDVATYVPPTPPLVDTGFAANPDDRYSFQFDGYVQEIDHILISRSGLKDFISVSNAHGNADVSEASPVILDDTTPARSGDHDGQVVQIAIDRIFANGFEVQP